MTPTRAFICFAPLVVLAACSVKEPRTPASSETTLPTTPTKPIKPATAPPREVYSRLAGHRIKPIEVKPITVKADCSYRDPTGYGGKLMLAVDSSQVRALSAEIEVPNHGNCAFALQDFRQTKKEPAVTLSSKRDACTVRLWEQEGRVTVAFNGCQAHCESDSFDYVWPILVDARTGACS